MFERESLFALRLSRKHVFSPATALSLMLFFAFAMQCKGTKTVLTYEFGKDLVRGTIQTLIQPAPKYSSSILIMMRRVGDCPGQEKGKAL